ncbi:hypothetical protein [Pontibacillus salipaludis]|uniref:Uncharacterized protein n=1 Tax=Pontibacillus salipaludis TaxID=1697394 RepID=A0ABQ1Q1M6_9BACI|nr:hypothetical protein [Pontibacillus salipaludis]GGD10043.1 hypothetical protein GCM10011389_16960 [Pontibacillus salipaludis]
MQGTRDLKEKMLDYLDKEIDALINQQNKEIQGLKEVIETKEKKIFKLTDKMVEQQNREYKHKNEDSQLRLEADLLLGVLYNCGDLEFIKAYLTKYREQVPTCWVEKYITVMKELMKAGDYQNSALIIQFLLESLGEEGHELQTSTYNHLLEMGPFFLLEEPDVDHLEYPYNLTNVLYFYRSMATLSGSRSIKQFLKDHVAVIKKNVFRCNSPKSITELIRCYFAYDLIDGLDAVFTDLEVVWPSIKGKLTAEQLSIILLIALYLNRDRVLLPNAYDDKYHNKSRPEMKLYWLYKKTKNNKADNLENRKDMEMLIHQSKLLSRYEKEYFTECFTNRWVETSKQTFKIKDEGTNNKLTSLKVISVLPAKQKKRHSKKFEHTMIRIALYKSGKSQTVHEYFNTPAMKVVGKEKYYLTDNQLNNIKKKRAGYWMNVGQVDEGLILMNTKRTQLKSPLVTSNNKQPISKEDHVHMTNETKLSDKSQLRKLGYQITGTTRVKRWEILSKKAVPQMGVKEVASIIAFLIRGRKAMKNGESKNRYSISEWEYDLNRLKRTYFKNDFNWPSTTVRTYP